jgi:hypothetical protein
MRRPHRQVCAAAGDGRVQHLQHFAMPGCVDKTQVWATKRAACSKASAARKPQSNMSCPSSNFKSTSPSRDFQRTAVRTARSGGILSR